ncbi:hypothetical protein TcBrA4_0002350 [Trypanosoma cruzi]|nr:hypothetical protein TcBrA4_0002350 [Trypanosoma cruzi]
MQNRAAPLLRAVDSQQVEPMWHNGPGQLALPAPQRTEVRQQTQQRAGRQRAANADANSECCPGGAVNPSRWRWRSCAHGRCIPYLPTAERELLSGILPSRTLTHAADLAGDCATSVGATAQAGSREHSQHSLIVNGLSNA